MARPTSLDLLLNGNIISKNNLHLYSFSKAYKPQIINPKKIIYIIKPTIQEIKRPVHKITDKIMTICNYLSNIF